jgi:hypothetical protein
MAPGSLLPHTQGSATCLYPKPAQSSSYPNILHPWRTILILSFQLLLGLPSDLFIPYIFTPLTFIIFSGSAAQSGLRPPHSRDYLITHKDTLQSVWLLLDEWSARRWNLCLTTHKTDKHPCPRWNSNLRSSRQIYALNRAVKGTGHIFTYIN